MIFLVEVFRHFVKNILRKNVLSKIPLLNPKKPKNYQKETKIATIAYNMKGFLRFFNFIF